jgi:hypothetical protein
MTLKTSAYLPMSDSETWLLYCLHLLLFTLLQPYSNQPVSDFLTDLFKYILENNPPEKSINFYSAEKGKSGYSGFLFHSF